MAAPRVQFGVAAAENGRIYAIAASDFRSILNSVFEYDPVADTWTTRSSLGARRADHAVTETGGLIYAVGGCDCRGTLNTVEVYNPVTDPWTGLANMPSARWKLAVAATENKLYVFGGTDLRVRNVDGNVGGDIIGPLASP